MQTALIILALAVLITAVDFVYDIVRSRLKSALSDCGLIHLLPFGDG
jgi:hypothetical protein